MFWSLLIKRFFFFGVLVAILFSGLSASPAQAAPISLRVSPVIMEDEIGPGERIIRSLTIENLSSQALPVRFISYTLAPKGEQGELGVVDSPIDGLSKWIETPVEQILSPGVQVIQVPIAVPQKAKPGTQLAALALRPLSELQQDGGDVQVQAELMVVMAITVKGEVSLKADIASFSAPIIATATDVPLNVRLKNEGSVAVRPVTTLSIRTLFGGEVETFLADGQGILTTYPGSIRQQTYNWSATTLPGIYRANVLIRDGQLREEATRLFIYFPLPALIGVLVALGVALFVWLSVTKRLHPIRKKIIRKLLRS